jgi:uncharacterized protein
MQKLNRPVLAILLIVFSSLSFAQARNDDSEITTNIKFKRSEVMIPMRDGVRLHAVILAPEKSKEPLPFLMQRTPYGVDGRTSDGVNAAFPELVQDGYIFVFQDIRGRYKSEGEFVMARPPRSNKTDPKSFDESTDTYDTIDWLVKNIPNNNGRVGVFGISYPGWTTVMAQFDPHPALKCVSPQAAMGDVWMGDDFFHNGAFRLSYGFEYAVSMESTKDGFFFEHDRYDTYDWYLKLGPLANVNKKYLMGKIPTWNDYVAHPSYDQFWQQRALATHINKVTVPTLNVIGWWDQEDYYGPMKVYEALEKYDTNNQNFVVIGPWNHGGWARGKGDHLGKIQFGSATGRHYNYNIQRPFFAQHLKGKGTIKLPEATTFQTGSNEWKAHAAWPPKQGYGARNLYLQADGKLSFNPPTTNGAFDEYISDPKHPVPYRARPIQATYHPQGSDWRTWLVEDQRFVHNRPDVLSWESDVLTEDLTITGQILVKLFASTSGSDSDWVVKLIDVYPEEWPQDMKMSGNQLMVASEILRGRYRNSFEKPEAITPNEVTKYDFDIRWADHTFKKGHRMMVQIQSTWFPLYDRNPQKFVENIFKASESDYQPATQRVFRSPQHPTHLILPVKTK